MTSAEDINSFNLMRADNKRLRAELAAEKERCAKIVEDNQETHSGEQDESFLTPRKHGNRSGLAFARAIRTSNAAPVENGDTGNAEADSIIDRLMSSDPDFNDCSDAAVFVRKLVVEHRGPDGFATWKDAAIHERQLRASNAAPPKTEDDRFPPVVRCPFCEQGGFLLEGLKMHLLGPGYRCQEFETIAAPPQPRGLEDPGVFERPAHAPPHVETFPQPKQQKTPCGECRLPVGETCDICGASHVEPSASDDEPCTDCEDTGITIQTERRCSCAAGLALVVEPSAAEKAHGKTLPAMLSMVETKVDIGEQKLARRFSRRIEPSAAESERWVSVPAVPTDGMVETAAAWEYRSGVSKDSIRNIYAAMLACAKSNHAPAATEARMVELARAMTEGNGSYEEWGHAADALAALVIETFGEKK